MGEERRVRLLEEDHVLVRDVRMHGHFVTCEIVVHEEAVPLVDGEIFHERGAHAHDHGADDLAARGFRIEDSARGSTPRACGALAFRP